MPTHEQKPPEPDFDFVPETVSDNVEVMQRNANIPELERSANTGRTVTCYNSGCPDYRRERPYDEPCACKKTKIKGVGDSEKVYF